MKMQDLRDLSDEQLKNKIIDMRAELFQLKNELALSKKIDQPHLIREKKKTVARVLTVLTERKK